MKNNFTLCLAAMMTLSAVSAPLQPKVIERLRDLLPMSMYAFTARASVRRVYPLISNASNLYDRKTMFDPTKTEFALLEISDDGKRVRLAFVDPKDKTKSGEAWFKTDDVLNLPKNFKLEDYDLEENVCLLYRNNPGKRPFLIGRTRNPSIIKLGTVPYKREKFMLVIAEMLRAREIGDTVAAYSLCYAKIQDEPTPDLYPLRVAEMLAEDAYQPGIPWDNSNKPLLCTVGNGGCAAAVTDFVMYNFHKDNFNVGELFDDASEIRGGDVLALEGHYIAVVSRNGNKLYTFDGNCNKTFRKSKSAYSIANGKLKGGKFLQGWHYLPDPLAPKKDAVKEDEP